MRRLTVVVLLLPSGVKAGSMLEAWPLKHSIDLDNTTLSMLGHQRVPYGGHIPCNPLLNHQGSFHGLPIRQAQPKPLLQQRSALRGIAAAAGGEVAEAAAVGAIAGAAAATAVLGAAVKIGGITWENPFASKIWIETTPGKGYYIDGFMKTSPRAINMYKNPVYTVKVTGGRCLQLAVERGLQSLLCTLQSGFQEGTCAELGYTEAGQVQKTSIPLVGSDLFLLAFHPTGWSPMQTRRQKGRSAREAQLQEQALADADNAYDGNLNMEMPPNWQTRKGELQSRGLRREEESEDIFGDEPTIPESDMALPKGIQDFNRKVRDRESLYARSSLGLISIIAVTLVGLAGSVSFAMLHVRRLPLPENEESLLTA